MSALSMLRHAATVVADRGRAYGDARQSMEAIAQRWSLTMGHPVTAAQVARRPCSLCRCRRWWAAHRCG